MAINTSRAPRRTALPANSTTGPDVAPGTYANTHNEPKPPVREGVAFNSLQDKILNPNKATSLLTPGPGAYLGTKVPNRTGFKDTGEGDVPGVGHIGFRSKSARMGPISPGSTLYTAGTMEKNPGPGTYVKVAQEELAREPPKSGMGPVRPVLEVVEKTMPSIPAMRLLPGQQPDKEGTDNDIVNVVMRHTGEGGDTTGPGEYEPQDCLQIVTRAADATNFHMSKLSRELWEPSVAIENTFPSRANPGPGSYDDPLSTAFHQKSEEMRSTYQFASKSPVAHQIEVAPDRVRPGPGQYELKNQTDVLVKSARDRSSQRGAVTRFGSLTERGNSLCRTVAQPFVDPYGITHVPGPGHYPPTSCFPGDPRKKEAEKALPDSRRKKIHGVHHPTIVMALAEAQGPLQAFNSTDDRPCNKAVEQRTPAPWQYSQEAVRGQSMASELREKAKVGRRGAFGTCADRFSGSPLDGLKGSPDVLGGGDLVDGLASNRNVEPKAVFTSTTPRFQGTANEDGASGKPSKHSTPAPGAYMIEKEINYRSPFRQPRVEHLSFGTGRRRFENKHWEDPLVATGALAPGPGHYDASKRRQAAGGALAKATRPKALLGSTTEEVGPGSYGTVETHMLKKTFNVTTQAAVPIRGHESSQ